jgi:hypothetical protein
MAAYVLAAKTTPKSNTEQLWPALTNLGDHMYKSALEAHNSTQQELAVQYLRRAYKMAPEEAIPTNKLITILRGTGRDVDDAEARRIMSQSTQRHGVRPFYNMWQYPTGGVHLEAVKQSIPWPDLDTPQLLSVKRLITGLEVLAVQCGARRWGSGVGDA